MGAVGGMLGLSGGAGGSGFAGPTNPVSGEQLTQSYGNTQDAIKQQQALLQAIQGQNGIGNQSQVYNQLQGVANGTGPNPAQAMLNQATGANVANQAALMAGQRGASQNVGLMARQAGQMGAGIQQQAVGQGAAMQANQSLNAIGAAGNIAGQQVGNQLQAAQGLANTAVGNQQAVYGAQQGVNAANANLASGRMQQQSGMIGGILNGAGLAMGKAEGGLITTADKYADGGAVGPQSAFGKFAAGFNASQPQQQQDPLQTGMSSFIGGIGNVFRSPVPPPAVMAGGPMDTGMPQSNTMMAANGGKVPAMVSPGERYLPPQEVQKVAEGKKNPMKAGEKIPGEAKVKGAKNSYANDTVPKALDEGGIVIPRSVTMAKDAPKKAADFVAAIMKKKALEGKS